MGTSTLAQLEAKYTFVAIKYQLNYNLNAYKFRNEQIINLHHMQFQLICHTLRSMGPEACNTGVKDLAPLNHNLLY
jgi:hypothetical protein